MMNSVASTEQTRRRVNERDHQDGERKSVIVSVFFARR
jgi:hypothetical protein